MFFNRWYFRRQFWKFVVTGAENNSVLKIWSCQSWACMQTITFAPSPKYPTLALKAGLDQSAKYLLLSDIHRRVLFILHFDNNNDDTSIYCKKISEFFLPSPILSFGIVDAGKCIFMHLLQHMRLRFISCINHYRASEYQMSVQLFRFVQRVYRLSFT